MKPKTRRSNIYRHQTEMDATKMEREREREINTASDLYINFRHVENFTWPSQGSAAPPAIRASRILFGAQNAFLFFRVWKNIHIFFHQNAAVSTHRGSLELRKGLPDWGEYARCVFAVCIV